MKAAYTNLAVSYWLVFYASTNMEFLVASFNPAVQTLVIILCFYVLNSIYFEQDATKGYLKLLVVTAAEGDSAGGTSKRFVHQMTCESSFCFP